MTFVTTPESAEVNARWAPMTSLLRRLTSAPVRVRVKKAIGIRWTCSKTRRRRSRMSPSPRRDDCSRPSSPTTASATLTRAMTTAITTTVRRGAAVDDGVDGPAGEDRRDDAEHGGRSWPGRGTTRSCAGGAGRTSPPGAPCRGARPCRAVLLHRAAQRHPRVDVAHHVTSSSTHGGHATGSSLVEVNLAFLSLVTCASGSAPAVVTCRGSTRASRRWSGGWPTAATRSSASAAAGPGCWRSTRPIRRRSPPTRPRCPPTPCARSTAPAARSCTRRAPTRAG